MKSTLSALVIILIILSCSEPQISEEQSTASLSVNLEQLNELKEYYINSDVDTVIVGEKGTRIVIEKASFVDLAGQAVKGTVELRLKEVINISDILMENISTVTDEGMLETRGMIKIEAFSEGKELKLADEKSIKVLFPKPVNEDKAMKLYYGKRNDQGILEWELPAEPDNLEVLDKQEMETDNEDQITKEISIRYQLLDDVDHESAFFKNNEESKALIDSLITFTETEKQELVNQRIRIYWLLFDDGDLDVYHIDGALSNEKKQEIIDKLNEIPFIKPFEREGDIAQMKGSINISFLGAGGQIIEEIEMKGISRFYEIVSTRLGWINCDFFLELEEDKIQMVVMAPKNTIIRLLFKNYTTIITGSYQNGKCYFYSLPKDEPINIIALQNNGTSQVKYSFTETTVQEKVDDLDAFKIIPMSDLASKLEHLN